MGTLFVVATPIGNLGDMTPRAIEILRSVSLIAAEDTRHSGRLLKAFAIETPLISYHQHNRAARSSRLLTALDAGDVALVSDAGTPAIADPGHDLVADASAAGHKVIPVPGASSMIAAVSASGLVPGPFLFIGFLPRGGAERRMALGQAVATGVPFVLFESPLRMAATLAEIETVSPGRQAVIARELTKLHEELIRGSVAELAGQFADVPPRGEVVLVIGGAEKKGSDAADVDIIAASILDQGVKPSRAARELSELAGIDSAEAYEVVRRIQAEQSGRS
jgi:16S rRNA (cytidine1402-2'-O)-methyltransferase